MSGNRDFRIFYIVILKLNELANGSEKNGRGDEKLIIEMHK